MHEGLHVVWELVLIVGSVFVFRSVWMLLDGYLGNGSLWLLLVIGFVFAVPALYVLNNHAEKEYTAKKKGRGPHN